MKKHYIAGGIFSILAVAVIILLSISSYDKVMSMTRCVRTITTTIYTTLITLLLALLTLAITAYVFVTGFLKDRQKSYEKKSIDGLLRCYTNVLIFLTLLSLILLLSCFLIDNDLILIEKPISRGVIIVSSIVSFFLLIYTCCIICHNGCLTLYTAHVRKKLFPVKKKRGLPGNIDNVFKWIGDLEMLVERLVQNHRDSFHASNDESVLRSITSKDFAEDYNKLISYRNFLWVEDCDSRRKDFSYPEYHTLRGAVRKLEDQLRRQFLVGERMQDQSFTAPFLSLSMEPLCLNGAVFTNSVFEKGPDPRDFEKIEGINFRKAKLQGADFTRARLNYVNLSGANCKEAVFSDAVLNHILTDAESNFERAVFQNTDFCGQKFSDKDGVMQFKSASFVNALLVNCFFSWCDFRQASFNDALMSSIELDSVCLSYADLSRAILTNAKLSFQQGKGRRFDWKEYWLPSQLDEKGQPLSPFIDSLERQQLGLAFFVNLEKCVLSQSCIENYNFVGSRMSGANFSDAFLKHCILDRCYGQNATFQETILENCRFSFAMFSLSDFSHAHIIDCDFSDCDLRDSLLVQTEVCRKNKADSRFCRTNFTHAQIRGARFSNCDFTQALFEDADLRNSTFENCVFKDASFDHSDLRGALFKTCDLDGTVFNGVDRTTFQKQGCRETIRTSPFGESTEKGSDYHGN